MLKALIIFIISDLYEPQQPQRRPGVTPTSNPMILSSDSNAEAELQKKMGTLMMDTISSDASH